MPSEKQVIIADSTQLSLVDECPQKWVFDQYECLESDVSYKDAILMGSYGHKLLELYYKAIALYRNPSKAREQAMDMVYDEHSDVWILPDYKAVLTPHEPGKPPFPQLHTVAVVPFALDKEKISLVRDKFDLYWQTQLGRGSDFVPESPDHVECGFSERIYEDDNFLFILEGKMDIAAATWQGLSTLVDHKFQLRARDLYKKSYQFRNYAMVAKKNMMMVNYIRLTKGVSDTTFKRDIVSFTSLEHENWRKLLIERFFRLAAIRLNAQEGLQVERTWGSCSGKFGYPCDYAAICEAAVCNPSLVTAIKSSQFHKKEVWKPW